MIFLFFFFWRVLNIFCSLGRNCCKILGLLLGLCRALWRECVFALAHLHLIESCGRAGWLGEGGRIGYGTGIGMVRHASEACGMPKRLATKYALLPIFPQNSLPGCSPVFVVVGSYILPAAQTPSRRRHPRSDFYPTSTSTSSEPGEEPLSEERASGSNSISKFSAKAANGSLNTLCFCSPPTTRSFTLHIHPSLGLGTGKKLVLVCKDWL